MARPRRLGRVGAVEFSVVATTEPWRLECEALVVPAHLHAEVGQLAMAVGAALGWEPGRAGAERPSEAQWVDAVQFASRPWADHPDHPLRGLVLVTSQEPDDVSEELGLPTIDGVSRSVGSAVRLAERMRITRLAVPLVGAGAAGLVPSEAADAVVAAARVAITNRSSSSLTEIVFVAFDASLADLIRAAWAGYKTQGFANDRPEGPDLLGVRDEVHALADMLLLREVSPPLAVGVLGGWGSGKSFVLHLLRERMREIRCEVIAPGGGWSGGADHPFVGHVYPIDFNAWTYTRDDLWAALMQRVLEELDRQIGIERRIQEKGRRDPACESDLLLDGSEWDRLTSTPADLHALYLETPNDEVEGMSLFDTLRKVHEKDQEDLDLATNELGDLKKAADAKVVRIQRDVDERLAAEKDAHLDEAALDPLAAVVGMSVDGLRSWIADQGVDLAPISQSATTTLDGLRALQSELGVLRPPRARAAWEAVKRNWPWAIGALVVLGIAVALLIFGKPLAGALGAVTAAVGVVLGWARSAMRIVGEFQAQARTSRVEVDEAIRELEACREDEVDRQRKADPALQETERKIAQKETTVEALRKRVGLVGRYESVGELVSARLEQGTYAERLGMMQKVSDDLTSLTNSLIVSDQDSHAEEKMELFPRGPARVVLFIDDLDRCPPKKVVEVLEAVQLLLATDLFVVVLALDVRYVTKALEKVYRGVLSAAGDPSGLDYLEKIIQIPYRTRRPTSEAALAFMAGQLHVTDETGQPVAVARASATVRGAADGARTDPVVMDSEMVVRELMFTNDDLIVIATCCRVLELTPRSGKRVANAVKLFRLVWARRGRGRAQLSEIATVALIVGLSAAHPEVQRDALAHLERVANDRSRSSMPLHLALREMGPPPGLGTDPEVDRFLRWQASLAAFDQPVALTGAVGSSIVIGGDSVRASRSIVEFVAAFCFVDDDRPRLPTPAGDVRLPT